MGGIISKLIGGGGGGGGGLNEAQVDARIAASARSKTYFFALSDDSVWSYDFGEALTAGSVIVAANVTTTVPCGVFSIRARSSPHVEAIASQNIDVLTGALTGTTGTDGNITISTHTDFKLYLENRRGGSVSFAVTINTHLDQD